MKNMGINKDLMQILLNIVIIGLFSIIENWLLFYYDGTWHMPVLFAILSVLMYCVLAINIYNCILGLRKEGNAAAGNQELLNQMKKLEEELNELKKNQLLSTKAILTKEEELQRYLHQ